MNSTKHKCPHCEEEYSIKWENEDLEPTTYFSVVVKHL